MKVRFHLGLAERAFVARVGKVENELNEMSLFASNNFGNDVLDSQDFGLQSAILEIAGVGKVGNELNGMSLFAWKNFGNDVLDSQDFDLQSVILEIA